MASARHCLFFKHKAPSQTGCGLAQLFKDLSTPLGTGFGGKCVPRETDVPGFLQNQNAKRTQSVLKYHPTPIRVLLMKHRHHLVTALLLTLLMLPALAQRLYDGSGRQIGRVDGERFYSASGQQIGRVDAERVYDGSGRQLGRIDGDRVYNASGSQIGRIDGDRLYSASGTQMGRIDGERLYDGSGRQIGRADGLRRMQMIVFFYFFM